MAIVTVNKKAAWVKDDNVSGISGFNKILHFFVINTPVEELSSKSKTLASYGWTDPWGAGNNLRKQLIGLTSTRKSFLYFTNRLDSMDDKLKDSRLLTFPPPADLSERVCIYDNQHNQILSLFYHIRNSLAHGRFNVEKAGKANVLIMEDIGEKIGIEYPCSARMIIQLSTMKKWIELIEAGPGL